MPQAKTEQANSSVTLYRGMKHMQVQDNFLQRGKGGTELAPMSTTSDLTVAMMYAASENSLLLRVITHNFMVRGPVCVDIFTSCTFLANCRLSLQVII